MLFAYKAIAASIAAAPTIPKASILEAGFDVTVEAAALVAEEGAELAPEAAEDAPEAALEAALDMAPLADEAIDEAIDEAMEDAMEEAGIDEAIEDIEPVEAAELDPAPPEPEATISQIWPVIVWTFRASETWQALTTQGVADEVMPALAEPHWHA